MVHTVRFLDWNTVALKLLSNNHHLKVIVFGALVLELDMEPS